MNQYIFEKKISTGVGCELSLCRAGEGGDFVVIKELTESKNFSNFEKEIEVLKAVGGGASIIGLRDYFMFKDRAFLVYEYYAIGDVFHYVQKNGPLKESQVIILLKKIAAAIKYARLHGFFHCDVKPENILIKSDSDFVLADWGLARHSDERKSSMHYGSKLVMAPEVILGQIHDNSDVYSLGCLAHYCLTGKRAYGLSSNSPLHEKIIAHLEKEYSLPAGFHSKNLELFVRAMMHKNPNMRPTVQDVIDFVEGDDKWLDDSILMDKYYLYYDVFDVIGEEFREVCSVESRNKIRNNTPCEGVFDKESIVIAHRLVLSYLRDNDSSIYIVDRCKDNPSLMAGCIFPDLKFK